MDTDMPYTETDKRVDWIGAVFITAGLVLIMFVLVKGESAPQQWVSLHASWVLSKFNRSMIQTSSGCSSLVCFFFVVLFLVWQGYLERIHNSLQPSGPSGLQSEKRDTGRRHQSITAHTPAADEALSLAPRKWSPDCYDVDHVLDLVCLHSVGVLGAGEVQGPSRILKPKFSSCPVQQLYYQNFLHLSPLHTFHCFLPMFVSGIICNIIVAAAISRVLVLYLIGPSAFSP
jgi:hypothetical protein